MTLRSLSILCRAVTAGAFTLALASCSVTNPPGPGGQITKVKYFHLTTKDRVVTSVDPPINFERQYHLYGAISNKEQLARDGHYYVVMWKVTDPTQPVKVRMELRQQKTGTAVKVLEQDVTQVDRKNITRFEVNADAYVDGGPVTSWRATLVRGKAVLAEAKSYLWD